MLSDHDRSEAVTEVYNVAMTLRKRGRVIVGGDFNSRTASNGDNKLLKCGRELLDLCEKSSLALVNSYEHLCTHEYTRVQEVLRASVLHTDQTTIDYVLADHLTLRGITNLEFIHDANLDSDHKVLLLSTRWRYHRVNRSTTLNRTLKRKLKFEGRSDSLHSEFESRCEPEMVRLCAMLRSLPLSPTKSPS